MAWSPLGFVASGAVHSAAGIACVVTTRLVDALAIWASVACTAPDDRRGWLLNSAAVAAVAARDLGASCPTVTSSIRSGTVASAAVERGANVSTVASSTSISAHAAEAASTVGRVAVGVQV